MLLLVKHGIKKPNLTRNLIYLHSQVVKFWSNETNLSVHILGYGNQPTFTPEQLRTEGIGHRSMNICIPPSQSKHGLENICRQKARNLLFKLDFKLNRDDRTQARPQLNQIISFSKNKHKVLEVSEWNSKVAKILHWRGWRLDVLVDMGIKASLQPQGIKKEEKNYEKEKRLNVQNWS